MLLLNQVPIDYFLFSGGELQVKLPEKMESERVVLTWLPTKPEHIMLLSLTVNALTEAGIDDIDLDILYLPYARQDRVCAPGEAFSLKVICKLLDDLDVACIRIWDIHNQDLTDEFLPKNFVYHWEAVDIFRRYKILNSFDLSNLILCAPDQGGMARVLRIIDHYELGHPVMLDKDRDSEDGKIRSMSFNRYNRCIESYDILVVDDICDGGATFIEAAKLLKEKGAEELYLYVTHGIFSNGLDELCNHYAHIYCHHVLDESKFKDDNRLTILRSFTSAPQSPFCH